MNGPTNKRLLLAGLQIDGDISLSLPWRRV